MRLLLAPAAPRAAFGDSHFGGGDALPGFVFYNAPGLMPEDFSFIVHHLYATKPAERIIVMGSPQWFAAYHRGAPRRFDARSIPFTVPVTAWITSRNVRHALPRALAADGRRLLAALRLARPAKALEIPSPREIQRINAEWRRAVAAYPRPGDYPWSRFPADWRHKATVSRVVSQNPREGFVTSPSAAAFEAGLRFLVRRGARLCLYRTPVTAEYLALAAAIPQSRYAAFDAYIRSVATRLHTHFVDFRSLPQAFPDEAFTNQDHLRASRHAVVWPLVAQACFASDPEAG